jgi:hypothetical protein
MKKRLGPSSSLNMNTWYWAGIRKHILKVTQRRNTIITFNL